MNGSWILRCAAVLAFAADTYGQNVVLTLSSSSGSPGSIVPLTVSLAATSPNQPASVQWTMTYLSADVASVSVTVGAAAAAAGKTISCNTGAGSSVCVVSGMNSTVIQNGVVANVQLTLSASTLHTSTSLPLSIGAAASGTGNMITTTATGSVVTITQPIQPTVSSLSCNPATVTPPFAPTCTVTLTSAALSGGTVVGLTSNSANLVVSPTVTVPSGSTSTPFTPTTTAVATATIVQVKATLGASSSMANVTLSASGPCTYTLTPGSRLFTAGGGSTTVTVTTGTGCAWTATPDSPSWITLQSGGVSGNGNGSFVYSVPMNLARARLGTIIVSNQSFKVMQGGSASVQPFFDETSGDPYFDYVSLMASEGITAGCQATPPMYCPSAPVTRAEMSVFIVTALDLATGTALTYNPTQVFQDVAPSGTPDSNYFPFVQRIYQLGITAGCQSSPAMFCPDASITQGQMAVFMITSWMQANNLSTFTYTTTPYFTDVPATDQFFKFIQKMKDLGFWQGCGNNQYCEAAAVTRDTMAPMIMRAIIGAP